MHQRLKEKKERASNLDRKPSSSKYQRKETRKSRFQGRKKRSAYASAVFYEKFTGYRQYDVIIKMEHILFARSGKSYKFPSDDKFVF
jgi:hypothetical protein